jgi:hypothetical protein
VNVVFTMAALYSESDKFHADQHFQMSGTMNKSNDLVGSWHYYAHVMLPTPCLFGNIQLNTVGECN